MESIKCTSVGCSCLCFTPTRTQLRICGSCQHGWVAHAMDKIGQRSSSSSQVTLSSSGLSSPPPPLHSGPSSSSVDAAAQANNCLFDVASLILFGAEAIPTKLKILLDRLFLHLERDLVLQVLGSFGWSYDDYCRGYRIQDSSGHVLDKWTMASSEEEVVILDQFQRFTETKSIAEEWLLGGKRNGAIPPLLNHHLTDGQGSSSSSQMDVKQLLLNGTLSRGTSDIDASRHLFGSGAYLSSLLPRYPSLYNPFLAGPGIRGAVGHLSQASVLPYLLARSPLRSLPKPMDFRMEPAECIRAHPNETVSQGSPAKRNGKMTTGDLVEMIGGREEGGRQLKMEAAQDRSSFSSNETNFQSTDDDEPIDYSRRAPEEDLLSKGVTHSSTSSSSSKTNRRIPSVAGSPGNNQSSSSFPDDDQKEPSRKISSSVPQAKKPYQPTPGYGGTLISPNGKKRVLCTACLKTFCDKGALKIHYSAVHLKELHMCTIDGCTMTFSSRRSRNRHSANPNPKLHFGQTGRRRLHNNSSGGGHLSSVSSPFKEGQENSSSPPLGSPRSEDGSPASDGEFQLCSRSQDGLNECCNGSANQQPMLKHDDDDDGDDDDDDDIEEGEEEESARHSIPPTEGCDESQGSNTEYEYKTLKRREENETSQEPPRTLQGTSKRKSAIPTRCSIPPTEDSASDFQVNDLDSSDRKRRRLINNPVDAVFADSDDTDVRREMAREKSSIGSGEDVEEESGVMAADEVRRNEELSTKSDDEGSIVDLSQPSLARCLSSQSAETSAEESGAMMQNGKALLSQPERPRKSEERDSASYGCCQMDPTGKGTQGFQMNFPTEPADPRIDFQVGGDGGQRSIHVCKVQGCNANFPSKRSRDRHSANANLHRRLFYCESTANQKGWKKEGVLSGEEAGSQVNMAPIDERKKSLDTALNLTTTDQEKPSGHQNQPEDTDNKREERVEVTNGHHKETHMSSERNKETNDKESTMTDQWNRNHSGGGGGGETPRPSAKSFSIRKNRNLLSINENLHNHLLVNSSPASAQLAV